MAAIHTVLYALVYSLWGRLQKRFAAPACEDCDALFATKQEKEACRVRNRGCIKCDEPKMRFWVYSLIQFAPDLVYGCLLALALALRILYAKLRESETVSWQSHRKYLKNPVLVYTGAVVATRFFVESLKSFFNYEKYLYDSLPYETASAIRRCESDKSDYISSGSCPLYIGDLETISPGTGGSGVSDKHPVLAQQGIRKSILHGIFIVYGVFSLLAGKTAIEWLGNLVAGTIGGPLPAGDAGNAPAEGPATVQDQVVVDPADGTPGDGIEEGGNLDETEEGGSGDNSEEEEVLEVGEAMTGSNKNKILTPEVDVLNNKMIENETEQAGVEEETKQIAENLETSRTEIHNSENAGEVLQDLVDVNAEMAEIEEKLQNGEDISDEDRKNLNDQLEQLGIRKEGLEERANYIRDKGVDGAIPPGVDFDSVTPDDVDAADTAVEKANDDLQKMEEESIKKESLLARLKAQGEALAKKISGETEREKNRLAIEGNEKKRDELDAKIQGIESEIESESDDTKKQDLEKQKQDLETERQAVVDALSSDADLVRDRDALRDKVRDFEDTEKAIAENEAKLTETESEINTNKNLLVELKSDKETLNTAVKESLQNKQELEENVEKLSNETRESQKELDEAESTLHLKLTNLNSAKTNLGELEEGSNNLKNDVEAGEKAVMDMENEQKSTRKNVEQLLQTLENRKASLQTLQDGLSQTEQGSKKHTELTEEIKSATANIAESSQKLAESNAKLAELGPKKLEAEESLKVKKESLTVATENKKTTEIEVNKRQNEYEQSESDVMEKKSALEAKKADLRQTIDDVAGKKMEIRDLSQTIKENKSKTESVKKAQGQLKLQKGKIELDITKDVERNTTASEDIAASRDRIQAVEAQLDSRNAKEMERNNKKKAKEARKEAARKEKEVKKLRAETTDTVDDATEKKMQAETRLRDAETRLREATETGDGDAKIAAEIDIKNAMEEGVRANKNLSAAESRDAADAQGKELRGKELATQAAANNAEVIRKSQSSGVLEKVKGVFKRPNTGASPKTNQPPTKPPPRPSGEASKPSGSKPTRRRR